MADTVLEEEATWGDRVGQYSKAIVATVTPAVFLGGALALVLPAEQAASITAAVASVTGFLTWLAGNTEILKRQADEVEEAIEDAIGREI
ncbi:membrane protein [Gordonia phage BirthdayBoy]|uniref:Membrane protein n=2 Tax=Lambovirus TaxID=2843412 RepID=A0A9E7QQB6_9CAUD|nr:membrane protein [Gordonia phage ParvusTarda]WNM65977.1 membrane protein [Gordonia phage BirthdayBoy]